MNAIVTKDHRLHFLACVGLIDDVSLLLVADFIAVSLVNPTCIYRVHLLAVFVPLKVSDHMLHNFCFEKMLA